MRLRWLDSARAEQVPPPPDGSWSVWLANAGRGWGKTRTGAEEVGWQSLIHKRSRTGIIAPTYADARDTCIEGESGLENILPHSAITTWNRSIGEMILFNGTIIRLFSSDAPKRLRGPQFHRVWADELSSWDVPAGEVDGIEVNGFPPAWNMLRFCLRLGKAPVTYVTTTPNPTAIMVDLIERALRGDLKRRVIMETGSTFDNKANLPEEFLEDLLDAYEGTTLGEQELYAKLLTRQKGALWTLELIQQLRVKSTPNLQRVVVALDPSASSKGAHAGIVVAGAWGTGRRRQAVVLYDGSLQGSPQQWGSMAVSLFRRFAADRIVAEKNNGGEMVEHVLKSVDPSVPVKLVSASRGKMIRAEPIAALYEQQRVFHLGIFKELEAEMCSYVPGKPSPDRMDALVWGMSELMLENRGLGSVPRSIQGTDAGSPFAH